MSSVTMGTGDMTLTGPVTNYRAFVDAMGGYGTTYRCVYTIIGDVGQACAGEWETGIGYTNVGGALVRDSVFQGTNDINAVNFSAGTKTVMIAYTGLQAYGLPFLFGTGEDGDYVVPAGTTTVITQDKHWRDVTFANATTSILNAAGYVIRCRSFNISNLTATGMVYSTGANGGLAATGCGGTGGTGTARGASGGHGGSVSYVGATVGGGSNGQSGESFMGYGGRGGNGGIGAGSGCGRNGIGGQSGQLPYGFGGGIFTDTSKFAGGGGGGGGGGHSTTTNSPAGAGGSSPSGVVICCGVFQRASTNAAGTLKSTGGNGSVGTGSGGRGGGGGGGFVGVCCLSLSGTSATSLLQSIGGNGGTSTVPSDGGYGGSCAVVALDSGSETTAAPTAHSTVTGGTTSLTV